MLRKVEKVQEYVHVIRWNAEQMKDHKSAANALRWAADLIEKAIDGSEMQLKIEFFMPMVPPTVTAQEHGVNVVNGKPVFYDPSELKVAREKLMAHLAQHKPETKFDGVPVRLLVKWLFPRGKHPNGTYRITKPDTDNLQKLLKDCMTKVGFWTDDALVASEICEKFWSEIPGIYIRIERL